MTEPYNTDLMIQIREEIRANPEMHDQGNWALQTPCGTSYCIAGWAVVLAGETVNWDEEALRRCGYNSPGCVVDETAPDGLTPIPSRARQLLGLSHRERNMLFDQLNNAKALDLLDRMIEVGKNGERVQL